MFSNGNSTPVTFANFSGRDGNFQLVKDGVKQVFSQIRDVKVIKASVKDDEYEGKPLRKLQLTIEDGKMRSIVSFNMSMGVVGQMVAKLLKADLNKTFGLTAELKKEGSTYNKKDGTKSEPLKRDMPNLSVYQGAYINLAEAEFPPKVVKVTVGKNEFPDSTARDEWIEAQVAILIAKVAGVAPHHANEPDEEPATNNAPPSFDDLGDDIPF